MLVPWNEIPRKPNARFKLLRNNRTIPIPVDVFNANNYVTFRAKCDGEILNWLRYHQILWRMLTCFFFVFYRKTNSGMFKEKSCNTSDWYNQNANRHDDIVVWFWYDFKLTAIIQIVYFFHKYYSWVKGRKFGSFVVKLRHTYIYALNVYQFIWIAFFVYVSVCVLCDQISGAFKSVFWFRSVFAALKSNQIS